MKVTATEVWWGSEQDIISPAHMNYIGQEREARFIACFCAIVPYALLQTEAYARAFLREACPYLFGVDTIERKVRLRLRQQWQIFERTPPPQLIFVLDEGILYRQIGGRKVMRDQLLHMIKLAQQPFVTLQVLPYTARVRSLWELGDTIAVLRFAETERPDAVFIEDGTQELFNTDAYRARAYAAAFDQMREAALSTEATIQLMQRAADDLRGS